MNRTSVRERIRSPLLALVLVALISTPVAGAQPTPADDPGVIATWNAIAVSTITRPVADGGRGANAESFIWYAFVHAAMYNAVVGITREYELYHWHVRGPTHSSPEAAAAAAAHGVLMAYFGGNATIAANLDAALATSLDPIPDGASKTQGIRYGERAADRIIDLRANDGCFAPITFTEPPAPGVWQPTPPALAAFFDPWLGQMQPLLMESASQFRPGPPPAIASDLYVQEFNQVRDYGVKTGSLRTPEQTQIALFIADIPRAPRPGAPQSVDGIEHDCPVEFVEPPKLAAPRSLNRGPGLVDGPCFRATERFDGHGRHTL